MNAIAFQKIVLDEFPTLREDFEEWDGLIHLQVSEFKRFTEKAIKAHSTEVISKCFEIATAALREGDNGLRNAIYVSYLESLDLRSDAGKQAIQLMPELLRQGREHILDYDRQLLGRRWPLDDRQS